ncbi:MAG: helix-turn-helix domain-containing protein [Blastochloris sp.]|nr:helix-turn-helix domain-containing protein [Blastochloris sp.]
MGLCEVVVPLQISGLNVGYLVFGGFKLKSLSGPELKRTRHLLAKAGIPVSEEQVQRGWEEVPQLDGATSEAYTYFVEMAARHISEQLTSHLIRSTESVPELIARACKVIQRDVFVADVNLLGVARECAVSSGHLSRLFHQSTGLTFREYVVRLRAEHAHDLLRHSKKSVTEIAFESGFQSISQFHRMFRRIYRCTPRELRASAHAGITGTQRTWARPPRTASTGSKQNSHIVPMLSALDG